MQRVVRRSGSKKSKRKPNILDPQAVNVEVTFYITSRPASEARTKIPYVSCLL
jgi:hypothetical protein